MSPPLVIGESPLNAAAAVVAPVPPLAIGSAVPDSVNARVPDEVMGDPATERNAGTVAATLVTVPDVAGLTQDGAVPPLEVKTCPDVPVPKPLAID
jgi:hypothetical protein